MHFCVIKAKADNFILLSKFNVIKKTTVRLYVDIFIILYTSI